MDQVVLNNFCDKCSLIYYLYMHTYVELIQRHMLGDLWVTSRLTIVSREAKKKQAVRDEQVSYLHVAPL